MSKKTLRLLWILSILINIKCAFVDYCADSGYAVAMAYRLIHGDGLLQKMWEPHQSSAFLIAGFLKLYETVFGTVDGVVLFLHFIGMILFGLTAAFVVSTMKKYTDSTLAEIMGMTVFLLRAKLVQLPDYANLTVIFSVITFLLLIRFIFSEAENLKILVLSALMLCLAVVVYPSNVVQIVPYLIILAKYTKKKARNISVSLITCISAGLLTLIPFVIKLGFRGFISALQSILAGDGHSTQRPYLGLSYFYEFFICLGIALLCVLLALALKRWFDGFVFFSVSFFVLLFGTKFLFELLHLSFFGFGMWSFEMAAAAVAIIAGFIGIKQTEGKERIIYTSGILLSIGAFLAVMIFTNMPFLTIFGYMHLAVIVSFIPIDKYFRSKKNTAKVSPIVLCCLFIIAAFQATANWTNVLGMIPSGPRMGLREYRGECSRLEEEVSEYRANVSESDSVLIIPGYNYDPIDYVYVNSKISTPNTTSTPGFYPVLSDYWNKYPDMVPTVVAVPKRKGVVSADLYEWNELKYAKEYELSYDGNSWQFYRLIHR